MKAAVAVIIQSAFSVEPATGEGVRVADVSDLVTVSREVRVKNDKLAVGGVLVAFLDRTGGIRHGGHIEIRVLGGPVRNLVSVGESGYYPSPSFYGD